MSEVKFDIQNIYKKELLMGNITWDYLVHTSPDIIRNILEGLKDHKENPKYHPEGNAYDHIRIVTERLIKTGDPDLIMAGFFHDIGKLSAGGKSEEGEFNTSYGHEDISAKLVLRYKDWIQEMGANPYVVYEIVKNHMKIKFDAISKQDKDKLERYTIFQKLSMFTNADNMNRKWDLDEGLNLRPKLGSPKDTRRRIFDWLDKYYEFTHIDHYSMTLRSKVFPDNNTYGIICSHNGKYFGVDTEVENTLLKNGIANMFGIDWAKTKSIMEEYCEEKYKQHYNLNEGLKLQKKGGTIKFGRVLIEWEVLPPDQEAARGRKNTIKLDYTVDGIGKIDSTLNRYWDKYIKQVRKEYPVFKKHFEDLGYILVIY